MYDVVDCFQVGTFAWLDAELGRIQRERGRLERERAKFAEREERWEAGKEGEKGGNLLKLRMNGSTKNYQTKSGA